MARVLVVDDSAVMRRNIMYTLTQAGHEIVGQASDGGQAYSLYKTHVPDLVTMDITMPEVNGIEAVKRIIADFPKAKIIMVSALDQKQMVLEAIKSGAKHYIIKPINTENLIAVINKVLGIVPSPSAATTAGPEKEPAGAPAQEETESPFVISNLNSTFNIGITELLSMDNIEPLVQAAQGLLFVQPLRVVIDFGKVEALPEDVLNKIAEINKLILGANGKVTLMSQKTAFILAVKKKNITGLSELF